MTARSPIRVGQDAADLNRRQLLTAFSAGVAAVGAANLLPLRAAQAESVAAASDAIRPFHVHFPDDDLAELRLRLKKTRWPGKETVNDASQGIQLEKLKPLVAYWATEHDWRKAEAKLNALPQFITTIDGLDIHFIHVRSKHPNALPVIITHGWPGSVIEQLKIIGPLTDPTAHGGTAEDAFDVVIPSLPGFGFSGKPTEAGWNLARIASTWATLMERLGYRHYVAQGGDWGSPVSNALALLAPKGLLGIHVNLPAIVPPEVAPLLATGQPAPAGLSDEERATYEQLAAGAKMGSRSYATMMGTKPQTIGYAVNDSPAGLAAWMLGHPGFSRWTWSNSDPEKTLDEVLDEITLYWLTDTATSAGRIYWEFGGGASPAFSAPQKTTEVKLPVAITVFPGESYQAPESWAKRAYPNLSYFHKVDNGGHFAAWEQPALFSAELRAAFRPLRQSL
jgi:pimeloyl-ACP methyl ester carboxylesterase